MKPKGTIVYFNESTSGTDWTTDEILTDEFEQKGIEKYILMEQYYFLLL